MSRSRNSRKGKRYRIVRNSLYKKYLHIWSEDLVGRRKNRMWGRRLRRKLKREFDKEREV